MIQPGLFGAGDAGTLRREIALDIVAAGAGPMDGRIIGVALCMEQHVASYIPVRHAHGPNVDDALVLLKDIFEDEAMAKIGHNLKQAILLLRQEGIDMKGDLYDAMVAAYLLNPNTQSHGIEDVALEHLACKKPSAAEVLGKRTSWEDVGIDEAMQFAAENADISFELKNVLFDALRREELDRLYFDIEMPLIRVLAGMEEAGVKIDVNRIAQLSEELERGLATLQQTIYDVAGEEFNINSPRQLGVILFDRIGLKPLKKTKTGYSTSVEVLEELALSHDLPREILSYRTLNKLKTTYIDTLPRLVNKRTGRIHTSFNQTATATGRLSSSDPNLQNIPIRGEWGPKMREIFIADEGCMLLSADYSQVELRVLAHVSGDEGLVEAFRSGIDIHTRTAAGIFGVPREEVTPDMRRAAKVVNFGIVYGITPFGLSEALGIAPAEAGQYITQYFETHRGVKRYIDETVDAVRRSGFAVTLLGRKRPIPDIGSANATVRQQAERLAVNTPIQGTAADLIKKAMIDIGNTIRDRKLRTRMVLQIHDELLFEGPSGEMEEVREIVREGMENVVPLSVPLRVDIGSGKNWAEAH